MKVGLCGIGYLKVPSCRFLIRMVQNLTDPGFAVALMHIVDSCNGLRLETPINYN
jgi:hypothetical protein